MSSLAASRRRRRLRTLGLYAILIVGGLVMLLPFFWMLATSLKTRAEVFSAPLLAFPSGFHLENYGRMWNALPGVTFGDFFLNSLKIATLSTIGALVSCSMAAFAFAVLPFRGKGLLFALIMATLIIPFQVVLVPNFILYRTLPHPFSDSGNWIGTQEPLWVGAWLGGAFGIFLIRQFFLTVPRELADAGRVDGASPWGIFRCTSTYRSPDPCWQRWPSSHSCGAGTTCSARSSTCATCPATRPPLDWPSSRASTSGNGRR